MREHCFWSDCSHLPLYIGHTGSRKIQPVAVIFSHATPLKRVDHQTTLVLGQSHVRETACQRQFQVKTGLIMSHPWNLAAQIIPARGPKVLVGAPADKTFRQEPPTRSSYREHPGTLAESRKIVIDIEGHGGGSYKIFKQEPQEHHTRAFHTSTSRCLRSLHRRTLKDYNDSKGIDQDLRKIFVQRSLQDLNARIATRASRDCHRLIGMERPCRRSGEIFSKSMPQEPSHKHL